MGDYESPRVMGASGEATAPMVAVLADQGLPGATDSGIDIEEATAYTRLVLAAVVGGDEIIVELDSNGVFFFSFSFLFSVFLCILLGRQRRDLHGP